MFMKLLGKFGIAALLVGLQPGQAAPDIPGAKDFQGLPRFEGSSIIGYKSVAFDKFRLPVGPLHEVDFKWTVDTTFDLEGRVTGYVYAVPSGHSALEIFSNYQASLAKAGFETLFACDGDDSCGRADGLVQNVYSGGRIMQNSSIRSAQAAMYGEDIHYLAAKRVADGKETYLALIVAQESALGHGEKDALSVVLHFIEPKPIDNSMVVVNAAKMASDIGATGHIALYGIFFDFDSATVKPESTPTLQQIAAYLKGDPSVKVFIVGHTDNKGGYDYNMSLSGRRAKAVADALAAQHGVNPAQLKSAGVGFLAPLASNASDEGRAKNRRVELVRE
jgi:OmpA-OmpF porin, OOP family